jgi:uncharacterized membrane protein YhaH (DUF805 family)
MDFNELFTSLDGRISRAKLWIGAIILGLVLSVIWWIIRALFDDTISARILIFLLMLGLLYPTYAVTAKRFQDRDKPAMYALVLSAVALLYAILLLFGLVGRQHSWADGVFFVAFLAVGTWYLIELGFLMGTAGPNQYGSDPLGRAAV